MRQQLRAITLTTMIVGATTTAQADLVTIGYATYDVDGQNCNLIHDTATSLTWLDYSQEASFQQAQINWAAGLADHLSYTINDNVSLDFSIEQAAWRLPTTSLADLQSGSGTQLADTEFGSLFYSALGNEGGWKRDGYGDRYDHIGLNNSGPFENLQETSYGAGYWTATTYASHSSYAMAFNFYDGSQFATNSGNRKLAMAVLSGSVTISDPPPAGPSPVPEPATVLLFGSGLAGLISLRRRKG